MSELEATLAVAGYAIAGFFSFPVWKNESKWGCAAALFPVHCVLFWFLTNAAKDGRFIGAPVALVLGACVAIGSEGDAQWVVGLVTLFIVAAICLGGKDDKSSLL